MASCYSSCSTAYQLRAPTPALLRRRCGVSPQLRADPDSDAPTPVNGKRQVRVAVPNKLLAANTQGEEEEEASIYHVQIGSTRIDFAHDMKNCSCGWPPILKGTVRLQRWARAPSSTSSTTSMVIMRTEEEETELHEFCCENCATMFPARGRKGKFFPDDFKCPSCEAPRELFDMTDMSDPRGTMENDEDFDHRLQVVAEIKDDDENDGKSSSQPPPKPSPSSPRLQGRGASPLPPAAPPARRSCRHLLSPPPAPAADDDFDPLNNPLL